MSKMYLGKTCPYCKTSFAENDAVVFCSVCDMPHHLSCWQENNGCTTFGCTGTIKETVGAPASVLTTPDAIAPASAASPNEQSVQAEEPAVRMETLFEDEPFTIPDGMPVLIEKVTLIIDRQKEELFARCIFRSLTDKPIVALLVDVTCADIWGNATSPVEGVQFLDLKTKKDSSFGQTTPIRIPDISTREVTVWVKKALFADRTMMEAASAVQKLPKPQLLSEFFGSDELTREYVRETNKRARYTTTSCESFWHCACGTTNSSDQLTCVLCGAEKARLQELLDVDLLSQNLEAYKEEKRLKAEKEQAEREEQLRQAEERMAREKEEKERLEREEAERKAEELRKKKEHQKKVAKRTACILFSAAFFVFLVYAAGWHIIPYIRYTNACNAFEAQEYDRAYEVFVQLGDFSDSAEKSVETLYQKATFLMESQQYEAAAVEYERIPHYKDSRSKGKYCKNKAAYIEAEALFEEGDYQGAAAAFTALNTFEDSAERAEKANYLYAMELYTAKKYGEAYSVFEKIGDYKDSDDKRRESGYLYAVECFEGADYENATIIFQKLGDYQDSAKLLPEAKYQYAREMAAEKNWEKASELFEELENYKDSKSQCKESKYQHGVQLLSEKSYVKAVQIFEALGSYEDSKTKLNEAKYCYVLANKNSTNTTTYSYLKDLTAARYQDSKEIYDSLYAWSAKLVLVNTDENDYSTKASWVNKNCSYLQFCFELSGGPPGERVTLSKKIIWPDGSTQRPTNWYWEDKASGDVFGIVWTEGVYNDPQRGKSGTLTVEVYVKGTNKCIGKGSVELR